MVLLFSEVYYSLVLFSLVLSSGWCQSADIDLLSESLGADSTGSNPCKLVSEGDQVKKEPILCIGRLTEDIAVVTRDLKIWLLNSKAVKEGPDGAINQLYFGTAPPVPITEQWPELAETKQWKSLLSVPSCSTAVDPNGQYLMLDSKKSEFSNGSWGLGWNIDTKTVIQGWVNFHEKDDRTRWIGNTDLHAYYAMTDAERESEGIRIVRYSLCNQSSHEIMDRLNEGAAMGAIYEDDPNQCYVTPSPNWYHLCLSGSNEVFVNTDRSKPCPNPAKWALYNGFVEKGHFYLFGDDAVYSFPEEAYKRQAKATLRTIKYSEFIQCSGSARGRDDRAKKSPVTIGLIVAGILLLLLCLLCCLLCLAREAMARRQRSKGKKGGGKDGGKGAGPVGGLFPEGSARSKGLLPFGFLSGKKKSSKAVSKSKRSARLAGPGTLSKKGGGGGGSFSPTTKRSGNSPGTAGSISASRKGMTKRSKGGLSSGKEITGDGGSTGTSRTKRSKAISKKGASGGKRLSGSKKQQGSSGGASMSNKATERSRLKKRR